jgi:excisionase family DNA binding protein
MIVMEDLLTLEEVASILKVSKYTVKRWIDKGKLEGVQAGIQWRVRPEALRQYITSQTKQQEETRE